MIRLALVGCSNRAEACANIASRLGEARFVEVADADSDRANQCAEQLGASVITDGLASLLKDHCDAFDAAIIQAASGTSLQTFISAAEAGKHLLIEWPPDFTLHDTDAIIEACRSHDVRLMTGQASRFVPAVQTVKSTLESGVLGSPGLLRIHRWQPPRSDDTQSGPRRSIQEVDLAVWLFERLPTEVYAVARSRAGAPPGNSTFLQLHLGFPDGGMALIDNTTMQPGGEPYFSLSMIGSTGAAYADEHHDMQLLYGTGRPKALKTGQGDEHVLAECREFVSSIQEQREPAITGADGRLALEVADAVAASIENGRAVHRKGKRYELA